jgi:hypothetical protein
MAARVRGHVDEGLWNRALPLIAAALVGIAVAPSGTAGATVDLVIVAKAPGHLSAQEIQETIDTAIRVSSLCGCRQVEVDPISTAEYELLKTLVMNPEQFVPGKDFTPPIELIEDSTEEWRIYQLDPHVRLAGITVRFQENGTTETEYFPTQDALEASARFRVDGSSPGLYRFRADPDWVLEGYVLHRQAPEPGVELSFQDWPKKTRNYLIRIADFEGDLEGQKALFDVMGNRLVNRVVSVSGVRSGLFSIANFRAVIAGVESVWNGNLFTVRFSRLGGDERQQATRIWMLFPLSPKQRDEMVTYFEQGRFTAKTLAEAFSQGKVNHPVSRAGGDKPTELNPQMEPMWYEVPAVYGKDERLSHFTRTFSVENAAPWLERFATEPAYMITAYEGVVRDDRGRVIENWIVRVTEKSSLWQVQQVSQWLAGLRQIHHAPVSSR